MTNKRFRPPNTSNVTIMPIKIIFLSFLEERGGEAITKLPPSEIPCHIPLGIVAIAGQVERLAHMMLDDEQGDLNGEVVGLSCRLAEPELPTHGTLLLEVVGNALDVERLMAPLAHAVEPNDIDVGNRLALVMMFVLNRQGQIVVVVARRMRNVRQNLVEPLDICHDLLPLLQPDLAVSIIVSVAQNMPLSCLFFSYFVMRSMTGISNKVNDYFNSFCPIMG
jgi:hypothetical protein